MLPNNDKKEDYYVICVVSIDRWTLILKNDRKRSFYYETNASMSFILMSRMNLWCPIMERKENIMWISFCHNRQTNFDSKKWCKEKFFLLNQSINVIYPSVENEFMVPNLEKKRDYYVNQCLPQLINEL